MTMEQSLSNLNVTKLNPLSPEVISRQATINIAILGNAADYMSKVVKAISGVQMVELGRNTGEKLRYANAKIYKCEDEKCPKPECYKPCGSAKEDDPTCDVPGFEECRMKLLRHVCLVDGPVYDILMTTKLNGAAIIDGALLIIAANEELQISEHLSALDVIGLQHIIILQADVDKVPDIVVFSQYESIKNLIRGTVAEGAPIVRISSQLECFVDVVCQHVVEIPVPERNFVSPPNMIVNQPFGDFSKLSFTEGNIKRGKVCGSILRGYLKVNQFVEVRPGIINLPYMDVSKSCTPIYSRIVSLHAEKNELQFAVPGGLIDVELETPWSATLIPNDIVEVYVLGAVGSLPKVYFQIEVKLFLLPHVPDGLILDENPWLTIGSMAIEAIVFTVEHDVAKLGPLNHVCASIGDRIALRRRVGGVWSLIGSCQILGGVTVPPAPILISSS